MDPCGMLDGRSTGVTAIEEDPVGGQKRTFTQTTPMHK
jgi:hypothetical protein